MVTLKSMEETMTHADEPCTKRMKTGDVFTAQGPSSSLSIVQSIGMFASVLSDALDA